MKRFNVIIFMGKSHLVCLNKSFHSQLGIIPSLSRESVSLKISISSSRIDDGRVVVTFPLYHRGIFLLFSPLAPVKYLLP